MNPQVVADEFSPSFTRQGVLTKESFVDLHAKGSSVGEDPDVGFAVATSHVWMNSAHDTHRHLKALAVDKSMSLHAQLFAQHFHVSYTHS